ncbi:GNAT family N-acetyltransferase [Streptomyces sp. NPDC058001]|uniref:GNAT family N-acetyltransferase n=1 Tax=Streptomyces sp. NPDC058001 TaxID=3346300 RepID=UPI0036EFBD7D
MTTRVKRLTAARLLNSADALGDLLVDTVRGGSSLGFMESLDRATAADWWRGLSTAVESGRLALWAARDAQGIVGTVGVQFADKPNGRHRAEIIKLMVHRRARGQGLGRTLLTTAEHGAADAGVTLLHLDTETDSPAEGLYRSAGWEWAGTIPDYATDPYGIPHATTLFYKRTVPIAA